VPDLSELERRLVKDPFDAATRERYARELFDTARFDESLAQWRLLLRQDASRAEPQLCAALCCQRLDDTAGQAEHLEAARSCSDFDGEDPRLEDLVPTEDPAPAKRLHALRGGRDGDAPPAEVVSISRAETVRFADVVGMQDLKKVIRLRIIEPFARPGLFQRFKKRAGGGVMLYGPPGCGKTMMARAIATECRASFTPIGISDILNLWVGESERNLAAIFEKARNEAPSVLFFDELDALAFSRSKAQSDHTRTLVNEFLNQLDGMSGANDKVLVLSATNMPWDVDDAMKRPGRFDRQIFVPPPDEEARAEMLRLKLIDVPTDPIDEHAVASTCSHFSGADMDGLIEHAKDEVLAEILDGGAERNLTQADLLDAVEHIDPSTLEWLKTARNLVKFGGAGGTYKDVEKYLRSAGLY
jgi:SpoVK/Ycf46/Vps4 family AAA+-type ATPase